MKKREREIFLSLFLWCFFVFFITITKVKCHLQQIFVFTFSSPSRQQSINIDTFSSSHFHHHHDSKASTSSRFYLHFLINFTKGKYQLRHIFFFTFSSTSRKQSINFVTFSSSLFSKKILHEMRACEHQDCLKVCKISDL